MKKHPTIVIKLGTSSIVHEKTHQPLLSILALIVETATTLRQNGHRVIIVSSGAIGVALQKMGLPRRPKHIGQVQALAAIGQCKLMGLWEKLFEELGQPVAQILLTRNDIADRAQYLNAQHTFEELLKMGVVPIVNENDTLAVSEILDKFGDNDTLSAITAGMVQADYLFLMTDVDCLYDKNPRTNPDAKPIEVVDDISQLEADVSSAGSSLGTGGMGTKIIAAKLAIAAGVMTIITKSSKPGNITGIVEHIESLKATQRHESDGLGISLSEQSNPSKSVTTPPLHTRFLPSPTPVGDRKFWLLHGLAPHGVIYVDPGATRALVDHAGLLPAGIVDVEGAFAQQECVRLIEVPKRKAASPVYTPISTQSSESGAAVVAQNAIAASLPPRPTRTPSSGPHSPSPLAKGPANREVGRALVNYSASEIRLIAGLKSTEISHVLGYADSEYVALRENIALIGAGDRLSRPVTPTFDQIMDKSPKAGPTGLGSYVEG